MFLLSHFTQFLTTWYGCQRRSWDVCQSVAAFSRRDLFIGGSCIYLFNKIVKYWKSSCDWWSLGFFIESGNQPQNQFPQWSNTTFSICPHIFFSCTILFFNLFDFCEKTQQPNLWISLNIWYKKIMVAISIMTLMVTQKFVDCIHSKKVWRMCVRWGGLKCPILGRKWR